MPTKVCVNHWHLSPNRCYHYICIIHVYILVHIILLNEYNPKWTVFFICADGLSGIRADSIFNSEFSVWFVLKIMCAYMIYTYVRGNIYLGLECQWRDSGSIWGSSASDVILDLFGARVPVTWFWIYLGLECQWRDSGSILDSSASDVILRVRITVTEYRSWYFYERCCFNHSKGYHFFYGSYAEDVKTC